MALSSASSRIRPTALYPAFAMTGGRDGGFASSIRGAAALRANSSRSMSGGGSNGKGKGPEPELPEGLTVDMLNKLAKQGNVVTPPEPMGEDELNLPQFEGTPLERFTKGLGLGAEKITAGKAEEGVTTIEGAIKRAYREGDKDDGKFLETLAQAHLMAGTFRQNMGDFGVRFLTKLCPLTPPKD